MSRSGNVLFAELIANEEEMGITCLKDRMAASKEAQKDLAA